MIKQLLVDRDGKSINHETRSLLLRWMIGLCAAAGEPIAARAYLLELQSHHLNPTWRDWQ